MVDTQDKIKAWNELVAANSRMGMVAMVDTFVQELFTEIESLTAQLEGVLGANAINKLSIEELEENQGYR